MSDHRARYKNTGLDSKELRRRREENSIQLRKTKRDEFLSKKRTIVSDDINNEFKDLGEDELLKMDKEDVDDSLTQEMIDGLLQDSNKEQIISCAQRVRRLLSREPQPPFDEVIQSGLMPRLVQLLDHTDEMIQFEVAWILTNISSGTTEQTKAVIDCGSLPKLIKLLRSPNIRVCEQAVWALGNIIGDGAEYRDLVISYGMVPELLKLMSPTLEVGFLRNATWVLVNLCRNKDPPTKLAVIKQIMPPLCFLTESNDQTILVDTTWAISYITELGPDYSQLIIDSGLVKKVSHLIGHCEAKIQMAAIRALGCIASGNDEQTQAIVNAGAITELHRALQRQNDKIAKDALWFLSNVLAGSQQQIQAVIEVGFAPVIIQFLSQGDYLQQKEASWAVYNLCLVGSPQQLKVLIFLGVIPALCDLLTLKDTTLVRNVLEALKNLLKKNDTEDEHNVRDAIEQCGGLDKIEILQDSTNEEIYNYAHGILEQYFQDGDDDTS